jgi:hypothetical protein
MATRLATMIVALLLIMTAAPIDALAASVYIRLAESGQATVLTVDPISISASDATHSASANLTTGAFLPFATCPVATTIVNTGAGISNELDFTNNNPFPFTIWAGTLRAHIEGIYSVVPPGPSLGTGTDSVARLQVSIPGTAYHAEYRHTLRANGNPPSDQNIVTPITANGGTVVVSEASFTDLVADLSLPTITLLPGQTMVLSFQVDVSAQRNSSADFFSTGGAQLAFDLPAGIVLDTDSSGPLDWVTVPEPGLLPGLAAGWIALVGVGRLGRQRSK